jgi:hypothetical protein
VSDLRTKMTDEQLAECESIARELCEPGESVEVHEAACPIDEDDGECMCDPLTITVPKEQA